MNISLKHTALAMALLGTIGAAQATALVANVATANVDVVDGSFGGILLDKATSTISNLSYNGTARTAVYDTGTGLDFYYQFTNNASSKNGVERFAAFGIFTAGTELSDYADRSAMNVFGISFVPSTASKINPGTTSFTQIIRTNARAYTAGNFGILDGIGSNARGFASVSRIQ